MKHRRGVSLALSAVNTSALRKPVLRWLVCAALVVVGVLVTLGCLLALYLELEGFGTPPMPRQLYLASLAFGAVAGVAVPGGACLVLLRGSSRPGAVSGRSGEREVRRTPGRCRPGA